MAITMNPLARIFTLFRNSPSSRLVHSCVLSSHNCLDIPGICQFSGLQQEKVE